MITRVVLCVLVVFLSACSNEPRNPLIHVSGTTMGTTYNVKYVAPQSGAIEAMPEEITQRLYEINKLMSTYDPESELSRFNQYRFTTPFAISSETAMVVEEAIRLGQLSLGVLDVTVGPLVNLWGFGPTQRPETIPSDEQINQARDYVGLDKLKVSNSTLQKAHPMLYLDLSTIAKGYAVDELANIIESKGISDYLVEIGGEMRVKGTKPGNESWRIAIEKPVTTQRAIQRIVSIGDNAIATSGDYRNYYEENGVRYSHLINPTTGKPIQHNTVAVTVVHPSSMVADGLATAFNVMGWQKAIELAEQNDFAVLIIRKQDGEYEEYVSPVFAESVTTY